MKPTYLYAEKEEREVEVDAREDVFVRNGHQNGGTTVGQDGSDWVLCYGRGPAPM